LDLAIPSQYPYIVRHSRLVFTGEYGLEYTIDNALEFDVKRRETAYKVVDHFGIGADHRAVEIEPGLVRFYAKFREPSPKPGNMLALIDESRRCPAVTIDRSIEVTLEEVTIHHAGGMGVIAQLSENLTLRRCAVKPPPDSDRIISIRADATHMVCCRGNLTLEDCEFSHQLDDAGNFHNVYTPIVERPSDREVIVRLQHYQQWGLQPYESGHAVELVQTDSLECSGPHIIASVTPLNREHILLEFERPLAFQSRAGFAVGSLHWQADVTVRRTRVHSNRARGFLVTTNGRAIFEDNYFHNPGAAILIEGDANFWYEAGAVSDVVIRRNYFENCNYGVWGRATIDIHPQVEDSCLGLRPFHRNIRIENNEFRSFHGKLLHSHSVDGLIFRNNTICWTSDYPAWGPMEVSLRHDHCKNVEISGNQVTPERNMAVQMAPVA
jgi:hypothetical protein